MIGVGRCGLDVRKRGAVALIAARPAAAPYLAGDASR